MVGMGLAFLGGFELNTDNGVGNAGDMVGMGFAFLRGVGLNVDHKDRADRVDRGRLGPMAGKLDMCIVRLRGGWSNIDHENSTDRQIAAGRLDIRLGDGRCFVTVLLSGRVHTGLLVGTVNVQSVLHRCVRCSLDPRRGTARQAVV
jgi:hypothetical protein